jgi:hypothetical protein
VIPSLKFSAGQALAERYIREALDAWRELVVMYFRFTFVALVIVTACMLFLPVGGVQRALAAGDATEASCPNESLVGFSAVLPECRGYEMVTPPYKAGEEPGVAAISTDGSSVLTSNLGTYAGRENSDEVPGLPYLASRTVGWSNVALEPPSSEFPAQQYWAATADLSKSLWRLRSPSEPLTGEDLYLREANGTFIKIGPLVPPQDQIGPAAGNNVHFFGVNKVLYQDASSDLSHVLFDIYKSGPLWPFDTTIPTTGQHGSLYEYSGVEQRQPSLVGVSDGKTVINGMVSTTNGEEPVSGVLPAGHLISDCQTTLGSEREDGYNAMSADGKTVFFTAAGIESFEEQECASEISGGHVCAYAPLVSEVYARLDGAQTVAISEPTVAQCATCQKGEPVRRAEFVGASEDGSKAFFVTEQELFPGDVGMNLFEYNFDAPAGDHVTQVSGGSEAKVLGVSRVSEDGSHVYFVAEGILAGNSNEYGRTAIEGKPGEPQANLYVFIRDAAHPLGETVFITPLSQGDSRDWEPKDNQRRFEATPTGGSVVFASFANAAAGGPMVEGMGEVFEFDSEPSERNAHSELVHPSGELVQVSVPQPEYAQGALNAESAEGEMETYQEYVTSSRTLGPTRAGTGLVISEDGSDVLFTSKAALTEAAESEAGVGVLSSSRQRNAYVFHSAGVLSHGEVSLLAAKVRFVAGLDASGLDVFVKTAVPMVASDVDGDGDVYDVRVDGGVPYAPARVPCVSEEACLGSPAASPVLTGSVESAVVSGGNIVEAPASVSPPVPSVKSPVRVLTRAQKLSRALGVCKKVRAKRSRVSCEKQARSRYRAKSKARKSSDEVTKGGK